MTSFARRAEADVLGRVVQRFRALVGQRFEVTQRRVDVAFPDVARQFVEDLDPVPVGVNHEALCVMPWFPRTLIGTFMAWMCWSWASHSSRLAYAIARWAIPGCFANMPHSGTGVADASAGICWSAMSWWWSGYPR